MQKSKVNKRIFRCLDNPSIHPIHFGTRIGSRIGSLGNIIFDILEPPAVYKYSICWVFLALRHKLYSCICEFVFVYLCI